VRNVSRVALAVTVLLAGMLVLPGPAGTGVRSALAQVVPTPTIPDILPKPSPSPSPSPSPIIDPDPDGDGDGGNNGGNNNGGNNGGKGDGDGKAGDGKKGDQNRHNDRKGRNRKKKEKDEAGLPSIAGSAPTGWFNTSELVAVANRLRSLGVPYAEVIDRVFPPFIIAGNATWTNTWGAPRYGPAPGQIRTHQGQDVFCDYGSPILASEAGIVEYDAGGLGGITTRLHRADGSYWYFTHLSDWNTKDFQSGDRVQPGDVIGYCGNTGNAATTAPHVHFGWYQADGSAKNPMRPLVKWLKAAEQRVLGLVAAETGKRVAQIEQLTLARRFGDQFVPDRSELTVSGESLYASGSYPASGAFALAEAALQAALSEGVRTVSVSGQSVEQLTRGLESDHIALLDLDSTLAELMAGTQTSTSEFGD
jgi:murein DD-endopeptidase MepM/ murein hydrolase activator NlpD